LFNIKTNQLQNDYK